MNIVNFFFFKQGRVCPQYKIIFVQTKNTFLKDYDNQQFFLIIFYWGGGGIWDFTYKTQNTTVVNSATENCEKATADPNLVSE